MSIMKIEKSGIVAELAAKHATRLARAQRDLKMGKPKLRASYESDVMLFQKWAYRVGKGWYGFSLGNIPHAWTCVLDEFLEWLERRQPDFEIHQVKMKFRSMRIYLGTKTNLFIPDETIKSEISKLQNLLTLPDYTEASSRPTQNRRKTSRAK